VRAGNLHQMAMAYFQSFGDPISKTPDRSHLKPLSTNTVAGTTDNRGIFIYDDNVGLDKSFVSGKRYSAE